jgi:dienelactone hydrolase
LKQAGDREPETEIRPETVADLDCTPTGQVSTSLGGEDVFTLNRKRTEALRTARAASAASPERVIERARARSGFAPATGPVAVKTYGTIARDGFRIEKLTYESEPGILVPALLYVPASGPARKPALVMVNGVGKAEADAAQERFARAGAIVLSIDARGLGETRPPLDDRRNDFVRYFGDYENGMTALLLAKTLAGMRAEDIVRGLDMLSARADVDTAQLFGYGKGAGAVPLLYAAAFDRRLRRAAFEGMLVSYESVVNQRIHQQVFEQVVPGALRDFDLPDLVAAVAPRPVWLINTVNPLGKPAPAAEIRRAYKGAEPLMHIRETREGEPLAPVYDEIVRK